MLARRKIPVINDFAVAEDAHDHRKTRQLRRILGGSFFEGWWCLTRLWRFAACRGGADATWDGVLGSDPQAIEGEADWTGMPGTFLQALMDVGFVEEHAGVYWVHDFHESQPHVQQIIDKMEASRENGKKGGRPKGTEEEPGDNPAETQPKPRETQVNLAEPSEAEAEAEDTGESKKEIHVASPPAADPPPSKAPPAWMSDLVTDWKATANACGFLGAQSVDLTPKRKAALARKPAGWRDRAFRALEHLRDGHDPFLSGENDRGWKAGFDWLLTGDNVTKILEGNWDPKEAKPKGGKLSNGATAQLVADRFTEHFKRMDAGEVPDPFRIGDDHGKS